MVVVDAWASPVLRRPDRVDIPEIARLFDQSASGNHDGGRAVVEVGPSEMVALMDAGGVDHVMLSAWSRPSGWVSSNDDVAEFVNAYPDRFSGVAAVNLEDPVAAVRELRRAVTELGFKALRVVPWLWKLPPNDRHYYPLYVACVELGIPFCTQVGHTGPLMPSEVGRPIPYLDEVLLTFPDLVVVGGHLGYPWTDETIALAWKHANFHIDTSAHLPRYYPPQLTHFLETNGRSKVLFGSNWPQLDFGKCISGVEQLALSDDARVAFLGGNASRVFGLEALADQAIDATSRAAD